MSTTTTKNVIDIIKTTDSLRTFLEAIDAAGLTETFKSSGPFTIFAPNDEAFSRVPRPALDMVLEDTKRLQLIIKNHVVAGRHKICDISCLDTVQSSAGQDLRINSKVGCKINHACVCRPDIECSNGIIRIIDDLLLPE